MNAPTPEALRDRAINEAKRGNVKAAPLYTASEMIDHPTYWLVEKDGNMVEGFLGQKEAEEIAAKLNGATVTAEKVRADKPTKPMPTTPAGQGMVWAWDATAQDWYETATSV